MHEYWDYMGVHQCNVVLYSMASFSTSDSPCRKMGSNIKEAKAIGKKSTNTCPETLEP